MTLIWTGMVVLVLFLVASGLILSSRAGDIEKNELILRETLLRRQHRTPLLLEVVKRSGINEPEEFARLLDIRRKVSGAAYTLTEQIELEKKFSELLNGLFAHTRDHASLKTDALYHSLQKEFDLNLEQIRNALNDYNFSVQKWNDYCKWPWFKIFVFAFKIRKSSLLQPL